MSGLHYQIRLEPDLEQFCFRGLTAVSIDDASLIVDDTVLLNAHELRVEYCTVDGVPAEFDLDPSRQLLAIHLPQPGSGVITVHISYSGLINDQYAGLYRSRYEHKGQEKWLATTQFQANDARRVFPCFDHPAQKGTFDLSLLVDQDLTAVSNTEIAHIGAQENGKNLIKFTRTPKMSPYLVFIGIGEFEFIEADQYRFDVRVVTTAGKSQYGRFALDMAAKALRFCELYTGIKYPLPKCDLIAVPDSIGAMENFGAIRHSENLLLDYPDSTSQADRVRIGNIIAHEVSHMWFGNLVSLADWKYLWLNEAFATFFTFAIPDHTNPKWQVWSDFVAESMQAGLERDALLESVPIETPPTQSFDRDPAPTPSSAPIIYNKGAAVLRMLASSVGEGNFKKGLHHYLHTYQYDSVTSLQFWEAFDLATGSDNQDFAGTWMHQPGFPLITVERKENRLHLRQQRFTFAPYDSNERWVVPIEMLLLRQGRRFDTKSVLLDEMETAVSVPPDTIAYKLNHDQAGFYRVRYDASNLAALGQLAEMQQLSAIDSFSLQNDLFALVRRGDYALDDYLGFIESYFTGEERYLPLYDIARNLLSVYLLLPQRRKQIAGVGCGICENALDAIGMETQEQDGHQTALLRNALLWTAHCFGSMRATQFGHDSFSALLAGRAVPADILSTVLKIGAATHVQAFEYLMNRLTSGGLAEVEMGYYLAAMGNFQGENELRRALSANLAITPKNLRTTTILAAVNNPAASGFLWDWIIENLTALRALHPAQMERLSAALVPVCGLGREAEVAAFCYDFAAENARAVDSIKMALEKMAINSRLYSHETSRMAV
jgi:tricorn protease interacting factor F2/3